MDKISYALGMVIGHNLKSMNVGQISSADFAQAVADILDGKQPAMADAEAQQLVQKHLQECQENQGKAVREAGEAFLAENAKKDGVVVLPSGLQYTVLREGTLRKPKATDSVECHYEGRLIDGTVFDSSYKRGQSATFPLNGVIAGWTEGVQLMGEGAKYRFFIPYHLAYGERGAGGSIPPYAALVFDVELVKVL
ncbi:MAG: FKBP-type peptidyl-prolyl cis-trans isomerase [Alloprevotella sp.]|nr:FKBP-type peptidyl-prolyl cis-trans isomerase [Bacteroidales bacterium]MDY2604817.1 FKBP-type peptidyl-prolyl cis-trans isomerase [Alloprevotella sp.]MCI6105113.1 FKBP-type peptidyl-prolyl cis-trans isomerase [Bacteroidales bacterium]MCI6252845.1 FKBP-type peptidyl-prolyl cis-trans isomerase [Bacteroidales bacterium]MCI7645856.1 FKBP-type peptidyl-prolyl cis-trans isomerase [Bacteroidales bacterium]